MRSTLAPIFVGCLFVGTIAAAKAWFAFGSSSDSDGGITLEPRTVIPGWKYTAEPLSTAVLEQLQTTDIINGRFTDETTGQQVPIFAANWKADGGAAMEVVGHTPDVCWVGIGWTPVDLGQPDKVAVPLEGSEVQFECRAFRAPGESNHEELVLWVTILDGAIVSEGDRWEVEAEAEDTQGRSRYNSSRRRVLAFFLDSLAKRRPSAGKKQFVRFSIKVEEGNWQTASGHLEEFAGQWIRLRAFVVHQ